MDIIAKLQNIDRRIIFIAMLILVSIPLIRPIGVPLSINYLTQGVFDIVETLETGDRVLLSLDYSPSSAADIHPQAVIVLEHLMRKGVKVAVVSFGAPGAMIGEQLFEPYEKQGLEYGTDLVNLGFIAGGETAIRNFGLDVINTVKTDYRGFDVSKLPMMQGIKDCRDFDLVFDFYGQNPGIQEWVRQVQGPLGIRLVGGSVTVTVPECMPFIQSGQLQGLLQGLRGAAEYELLLGKPGSAAAMMDAQSLGHLTIIAFILLGNLAYFLDPNRKKK